MGLFAVFHLSNVSPIHCAAGTVLFYLIRMEPFTAMNRNLQGGRFDHADRLFSNVAATWDNCLHSSSDVKELTPEFFHQPEFLLNSNDFNLGLQQVCHLSMGLLPYLPHARCHITKVSVVLSKALHQYGVTLHESRSNTDKEDGIRW